MVDHFYSTHRRLWIQHKHEVVDTTDIGGYEAGGYGCIMYMRLWMQDAHETIEASDPQYQRRKHDG